MACVPTELIQTELHHVRTLKIMTRLFRTGMLEELQLEPGVVQGLFPCVDELSDIHTRFLGQLLERRRQALCPGSTRNFVIHRLGDLLISQVRRGGAHTDSGGVEPGELERPAGVRGGAYVRGAGLIADPAPPSSSQVPAQSRCGRPTPSSAAATPRP